MTARAKVVSAPGKVLLAGGYLVLDRDYTGLVFGLDARIHVHVQDLKTTSGITLSEIIVHSPQFRDAEWRYGYRQTEDQGGIEVTQLKGHSTSSLSRNSFVETALAYALSYISSLTSHRIGPASINILADSDYYSQPGTTKQTHHLQNSRFVDFHVPLHDAHKTGLGSSAALVTAFTAAVLTYYLPSTAFSLSNDADKATLHNLAQVAHCAAQGKVGSGFDVAAAVYGSCVYRRFSPSILEGIGEIGSPKFSQRLKVVVEGTDSARKWDTQIKRSAVGVPKHLRLVMCDVDCGSQTVGMVKKVLAWREENVEEASLLWGSIQKGNEDLAAEFAKATPSPQTPEPDCQGIRDTINTIRSLTREMSSKSGVPIEPKVQTELLDACYKIPGVVGGVVPGAGGYDAIALLVVDKPEVLGALRDLLDGYKATVEEEDTEVTIGKVRLLEVRQEMEGVRIEDSAGYEALIR